MVFHATDKFTGYDKLPSQGPQSLEKYGQSDDRAQNDGVHKDTPLQNKVNHPPISCIFLSTKSGPFDRILHFTAVILKTILDSPMPHVTGTLPRKTMHSISLKFLESQE
jgi:hypothetical protein